MSHQPWEKSAPDPETPNPVTPTKPPRNAGAGQDNQDAQNSEFQYDSDELFRKKKKKRVETKKRERHLIVYVPIKLWQTGDRADMEEEKMMFDIAEEARKEMLLSGFKKPIHSKPIDLGLWKKGQVHESRSITYKIYKCPMSGRARCLCCCACSDLLWPKTISSFSAANFAITRPAMHKMIPRSSRTYKWLQSGM
jgi:hypothetical protein